MRSWIARTASFFVGIFYLSTAFCDVLLLEPNIQGYSSGDVVRGLKLDNKYYLDIQDMSDSLRFKYDARAKKGVFLEKDFTIDPKENSLSEEGRPYYSLEYYEKIFPIKMSVNPLEMELKVDSDLVLPTTRKNQNLQRQQDMGPVIGHDSLSNYEQDNRYFSFPIMDLTYRFNENIYDLGKPAEKRQYGNYYQTNFAMLFAGLDTKVTLFDDDYDEDNLSNPRARLTMGRVFMDDPKNKINLVEFKAGDVFGITNSFFDYGSSGRGITASSFKDFVTSADKTIDITGYMPNGWEAELYLNNQLIGFRQSSVDGRYSFKGIPVNYGLNDFKVMLYGPFGEVREEPRRYYSGTSPVKSGELGYSINAYQAERYLFEENEPFVNQYNNITFDSMFYYGVTDHFTLISGVTSTENIKRPGENIEFATMGAQLALNGVSFQYNTNYNTQNQEFGHHAEAQGNVYIGDLYTRYEYYGNIDSPISYLYGKQMHDLFESRFTGIMPFIDVPYYLSYQQSNYASNESIREVHARISPNFMRYYNLSIEDTWRQDHGRSSNIIDLMLQASYGKFRMSGKATYLTYPDQYLSNYGPSLEYRWDRYTFLQAAWSHDCRSNYSQEADTDSFTLSMARLFNFGGLTFSASADTNKNISFGITYNISIGKVPDKSVPFLNSETQMSNYGTVYAVARDENNQPLKDVKVQVNGREKPSVTDDEGGVLITDLEPYQKTLVRIESDNLEDISLTPTVTSKKLILRPGTVRTIDIPFSRQGGVEGQLSSLNPDENYKIRIKNKTGKTSYERFVDKDGSFIFDGIPFGDYTLEVLNSQDDVLNQMGIIINESFNSMKIPVGIN